MAKSLVWLFVMLTVPLPLAAQEHRDDRLTQPLVAPPPLAPKAASLHRPSALVPLYISFGALQAADLHSTLAGVRAGGREVNPLLGGAAGSPLALAAIKTAGSVATIMAAERLWKKHRVRAIVLMVAVNSAYAVITAHNYAVASRD